MSEPIAVLVVDDDERIRSLAELILRREGYVVVSASGPGEALALVETTPNLRVALIDVVLPMMTGFDLAEEIHRRGSTSKIVFMSGYRSDHFRQPVDVPVVTKPFTVDALAEAVAAALQN